MKHQAFILCVAVFIGSVAFSGCAETPQTRARDLYMTVGNISTPVNGSSPKEEKSHREEKKTGSTIVSPDPDVSNVLGAQVSLEKLLPDGKMVSMSPDDANAVFRAGERVRFNINTCQSGYIYIMQSDGHGGYTKLYPADTGTGNVQAIKVGYGEEQTVRLPMGQTAWFRFDEEHVNDEELLIYITKKPDSKMAVFYNTLPSAGAPAGSGSAKFPDAITGIPSNLDDKTIVSMVSMNNSNDENDHITIGRQLTEGAKARRLSLVTDDPVRPTPAGISGGSKAALYLMPEQASSELIYRVVLRRAD